MGFRSRLSGSSSSEFGALLLINIAVQWYVLHVTWSFSSRGTMVASMVADVVLSFDFLLTLIILWFMIMFLEVVSTLLFMATRWVWMALFSYTCAWSSPALLVVIGGPSLLFLSFIVVPLLMLAHIRYWTLEEGPRRHPNPLPGPVQDPFL